MKFIGSIYHLRISSILIFLLISGNSFSQRRAGQKIKPPNIIIILADDLGYGDLSCYGATKIHTPNIDRLAIQGKTFTDAHAISAICTPSRYSLLTGQYAFRKNIMGPFFLRDKLSIDTTQLTLPKLLKKYNFSTACIGKWHLGFGVDKPDWNGELKPGPLEVGFDYYYGIPNASSHPPFVYVENHRVIGYNPKDPFVFGKKAKTDFFYEKLDMSVIGGADSAHSLYKDELLGTTLTEKALEWIKHQNKEKPFFLYFATTNIHHPFAFNPTFRGTSEAGRYGDDIHELDWEVGRIMQELDEAKLTENTLVIFTSDNGGMLNDGGLDAWRAGHKLNGKLLGYKFDAWEGGHRIPFIIRWPGHVTPNSKSNQLISLIDMMGTVGSLLNYDLKEGEGPDSYNVLSTFIKDTNAEFRDEVIFAGAELLSLRKGKWLFINGQGSGGFRDNRGGPAALAITGEINSDIENGKIKPNAPLKQLYNLKEDVEQKVNVIKQYPQVAKQMEALLLKMKVAKQTRPN